MPRPRSIESSYVPTRCERQVEIDPEDIGGELRLHLAGEPREMSRGTHAPMSVLEVGRPLPRFLLDPRSERIVAFGDLRDEPASLLPSDVGVGLGPKEGLRLLLFEPTGFLGRPFEREEPALLGKLGSFFPAVLRHDVVAEAEEEEGCPPRNGPRADRRRSAGYPLSRGINGSVEDVSREALDKGVRP